MERKRPKRKMETKIKIPRRHRPTNKHLQQKTPRKTRTTNPRLRDTYLLNNITKQLPIHNILKTTFDTHFDTLMSLIFHRITTNQAMRHTENWYNGNYIKHLYPKAQTTSQDISKFLTHLGRENIQRAFFSSYIPLVCTGKSSVVIDSTGLPNEINMSVTDWGYHNGGIEYETRLILAVERLSELPLYFRYVAGNVGDVSTLATTIFEMKKHGITTSSALIDVGYYSEANLKLLFDAEISFLIRLPSNRVVYKEVVVQNMDVESSRFVVAFGKRGLFVKEVEVGVCGKKVFGYLVLDPQRRGQEISRAVLDMGENASSVEALVDFSGCGKMVLLSSVQLRCDEVVPLYYTGQVVERLFGIAKDDLGILPLRMYSEPNFKGFMMLVFISLIVLCGVKARLGKKFSIEQVLVALRNLKCKVFEDQIIPSEVTKEQRLILETTNTMVPKVSGI